MSTPIQQQPIPSAPENTEIDWTLGWRYETIKNSQGKAETIRIPLSAEERLHPEEGYVMPERTEHDIISDDLCDMFRAFFDAHPEIGVYRNLVFKWDLPGMKNFAPDVAVVRNVKERYRNRGNFDVTVEGTRPCLAIEIVSPNSRTDDRVTKVRDYARLRIDEYVYIDSRRYHGESIWEVVGYRLIDGQYLPILPDEDGALFLESVTMRIGIDAGNVWLEDANTTEELLTNVKAQQQLRTEKEARELAEARAKDAESRANDAESRASDAEAKAKAEAEARQQLEQRLAEIEANLKK